MRTSMLGSVAFVPVLVAFLATDALAAGAASAPSSGSGASSTKRVARRGPSRPAPLAAPPAAALPELPPAAPLATPVSTTTTSSAPMVTIAPAAASPVAASPAAASPAAASSAAETPEAPAASAVSPEGLVLGVGTGFVVPATVFVDGAAPVRSGIAIEGRAGYYFTRTVGVVAGFRGSFGHKLRGCTADACKGYSLQVPVMVQFAATSRARGFYGEVGLGLFTTYAVSAGDTTVKVSTPVNLKLGAGYRLGASGTSPASRALSADLNQGVDVGQMTNAEVQVGSRSVSGSIDNPTTHVVVALGVMGQFAL